MKNKNSAPQIPRLVHTFLNDILWIIFVEKSATLHYISLTSAAMPPKRKLHVAKNRNLDISAISAMFKKQGNNRLTFFIKVAYNSNWQKDLSNTSIV